MAQSDPIVGILMGSKSDWATMKNAADTLEKLGIPHEAQVISAHRNADRLDDYCASAQSRGLKIIIAGAGMAAALRIASEKRCYTISDRSTFLAQRTALDLEVLFEGDSELHNPYSVIVVNSKQNAAINDQAASQFSNFLFSEKARKIISEFGVQKYGQPLFFLIDPVATHN